MRADEPRPMNMQVGTKPPSWIKDELRTTAWFELVELLGPLGMLTVSDAGGLVAMVDAFCDYRVTSDIMDGLRCAYCRRPIGHELDAECADPERITEFYLAWGGVWKVHPVAKERVDAWRRWVATLDKFGMTPSSRTRIGATPDKPASGQNLEDLLEDVG